jgi:predicted PurR-regulated permease PerM
MLLKTTEDVPPTRVIAWLVDILLPVFLLALLIALCVQLLLPFVGLLLWTAILVICFQPVHQWLIRRGMRPRWSATTIGVLLTALLLVPTAIAAISAASSIPKLASSIQRGDLQVPPPPGGIDAIPLVGMRAHAAWNQAATNFPEFLQKYGPQLTTFTRWALKQAGGMFVAVLLLVVAVILAAITLAYQVRVRAFMGEIFARICGTRERGEHYIGIIAATVKSVANGVIGVAFVQALLCGVGFFAIGVPGAGILSLLAMVLGVLQIPVVIVTVPAIIYAFSAETTTVAIIFTIWSVIAGLSDAALKPLLIGHGLEVPMPVILLGVIGGVMAYGLVGLFIGAVLLAVGYVLFREWADTTDSRVTAH